MATQPAGDSGSTARERPAGWYGFAGVLFLVVGSVNVLQGFIALFKDDYYTITKSGLLFADFTAWGTFFLILGILEVLVGLASSRSRPGPASWASFFS